MGEATGNEAEARPEVERVGPWQQLDEGWSYAVGWGRAGEPWLLNRDPNGEIYGLCGDELLGLRLGWQAIELTEPEASELPQLARAVAVEWRRWLRASAAGLHDELIEALNELADHEPPDSFRAAWDRPGDPEAIAADLAERLDQPQLARVAQLLLERLQGAPRLAGES